MGDLTVYPGDKRTGRRSCLKHHNSPSFDLSVRQGGVRVVDLVEHIAPRHQLIQRQPALSEPPDEHGEIAVGPAGTAGRATKNLPYE